MSQSAYFVQHNLSPMKNFLYKSGFFALIVMASACSDDPPPSSGPTVSEKVVIVNQGPSANGTGSVSFYDPEGQGLQHNIFQKANSYIAGNVLKSIFVDEDANLVFLVLAGSGEIQIVDRESYKVVGRILNLLSPRYVVKATNNKYYITDWEIKGVHVYNHVKGEVTTTVLTGIGPERMLAYDNKVFVANSGGIFSDSTVTVIDAMADTVLAQLATGHNPNSMQLDSDNLLWVLGSGILDQSDPFASTPGTLTAFDPDSLLPRDTVIFTDNIIKPHGLQVNSSGTAMFMLDNPFIGSVRRFDIATRVAPSSTIITGPFNSIGYDPLKRNIYTSYYTSTVTPGIVYRYGEDGSPIHTFTAGLAPDNFAFH